MKSINDLFDFDVLVGGSASEGTKVGFPDEFDFDIRLTKLDAMIEVHASTLVNGHVMLKVKETEEASKLKDMKVVDDDGFLSRTALSKQFYQLFQKALNYKDTWSSTCLRAESDMLNWEGEGYDIMQMKVIWYGPFVKRIFIYIDIVPVIWSNQWVPNLLKDDLKTVDSETARQLGFFLVTKDPAAAMASQMGISVDELFDPKFKDEYEQLDKLFKVSTSCLEHAVMMNIGPVVKAGYKLAKSIQLQAPGLELPIYITSHNRKVKLGFAHSAHRIEECITSFVLKTALFHELNESGIEVDIQLKDLQTAVWNNWVLNSDQSNLLTVHDTTAVVCWALRIYKRLAILCQSKGRMQEYFLRVKMRSKKETPESLFLTETFCKMVISFLESFTGDISV